MTMKAQLFDEAIIKLKPFLRQYLDEEGVVSHNNRYICINPEHNDTNPSSTIFTDENGGQHLKCWSCLNNADIFAAVHMIEGKPVTGTGFFTETIPYLAERFNVAIPEYEISENEREEITTYRLYRDAAEYILSSSVIPDNINAELERRGWSERNKTKELGIGFVESYESFRGALKALGHTVKAIETSGLSDPFLFNENRLIFTYKDEHGRPVGFIARNLNFDGVKDPSTHMYINGPKYIFNKSPSNGVKILKKESRLYMMDKVKRTKASTVYIVEGQPDSISFHYHGYDNFLSLSGVNMSLDHFELLRRFGIYDIVICLDNDSPGVKAAETLVDQVLKYVNDIRVRFMFLPMTGDQKIDPDIMVRDGRLNDFFDLPKVSPFDFTLNKIINESEDFDPGFICGQVLPIIVTDPSAIRRETMISRLSNVTSVSEKALKEEAKRLIENKDQRLVKLKKDILGKLTDRINKSDSVIEAESMLAEAIETFRQLDKEGNLESLEPKTLLGNLLEIKRYEEGDTLIDYIKVDDNLKYFMKTIEGDLSQKLIFIPASPNVGKTTLFVNMIHSIVKNNPNYIVGFLSIDDSLKELVPRFICYNIMDRKGIYSDAGMTYTINHFSTPSLYRDEPYFQSMMEERNIAFREIGQWVSEGRLILLDSEDGRSFDFLANSIRTIRDKHPAKKILFFLDNLHLLSTESWNESGFDRIKKLSHETKALCVSSNSTIISTVELRKLQKGQKADNNDLAGSASLAYDANAIAILSSDLDMDPDSSLYFRHGGHIRKNPIIEINISKNKIGSFKGVLHSKLFASQAYYQFISEAEFNTLYGNTEAEDYVKSLT